MSFWQADNILTGHHLDRTAFPLGGIGAGMLCLEGTGCFSHVSLRHRPEVFHEPMLFSALCVKGEERAARVLEGPVPDWKVFFPWSRGGQGSAGNGARFQHYGLPRFRKAGFQSRFPFARVSLEDDRLPVRVHLTGWSPFIPGDADSSSLPVAGLEYTIENIGATSLECVYSFHAENFMRAGPGEHRVDARTNGFVLHQEGTTESPWNEGAFAAAVDDAAAGSVDCKWLRSGWFDARSMLWKHVASGDVVSNEPPEHGASSPGGSIYVPFHLKPGQSKTVTLRLAWYVPVSDQRVGDPRCSCTDKVDLTQPGATHVPWYAGRFRNIDELRQVWGRRYGELREESGRFRDTFYDTTLPAEIVEAIAANLSILKSPTVLRQADGRLWGWEGCCDTSGCCSGSCTHVWNYAQALPHLFPDLERSLRQTEFHESQDARGHQAFRSALPIRETSHDWHAAADGQLGGIMKVYREWRISADDAWLRAIWPNVKQSLAYCIATWDPDHRGVLTEPHHNTYDIEFWGADGMCTSFYLGALQAAFRMGRYLDEETDLYETLYRKGRDYLELSLFNGEYFEQRVQWKGLRASPAFEEAGPDSGEYAPDVLEIVRREGPRYQYGTGCLADGILGAWIGAMCGLEPFVDQAKVRSHLHAVFRHNFRGDLSEHANPQRSGYALNSEAGLLLCTWPRGGEPSLPFPYCHEVWTGFEYQVASHLMMLGHVEEGRILVRAARSRYDGRVRNPFNEYECGSWYARAMSAYGLLQGLTGVRYDAVERTLYLSPSMPGDFRVFLSTASGYGTAGVRNGEPFLEVRKGHIPADHIVYAPFAETHGASE